MYKGDGDPNNIHNFDGMPHAYGMIPRTFEDPTHKMVVPVAVIGSTKTEQVELGGDEDPLDIFVLSERKIPMGQVRCKVIGVIHFVDGGEIDYKVIAVDADY
jgi:inorganic pyrophosphatase